MFSLPKLADSSSFILGNLNKYTRIENCINFSVGWYALNIASLCQNVDRYKSCD